MNPSNSFGTEPIGALLRRQSIPASVGILIMSIYGIVDTIFVGRFVGSLGIGAIAVVLPITFFIGAIGMAIGGGGASVISRSLGEGNHEKAAKTFGNQTGMTMLLSVAVAIAGYLYIEEVLSFFGGRGGILAPAKEYFEIILLGVPFLAWSMMSNNVIRSVGHPKVAMLTLIVPAVANTVMDPILIIGFDMGMAGAAWATSVSYVASALFSLYFFVSGKSNLKLSAASFHPDTAIMKEVGSLGSIILARQGTISLLSVVLNNTLFVQGGESAVTVFGLINRVMMFANFPVIGVSMGFLPIAGYNYGAKLWDRLNESIYTAIKYGTGISLLIFALIMLCSPFLTLVFTDDPVLLEKTPYALRIVFLATPLLAVQLISSGYFQAVGKVVPALLLTLTKQGFCLIPLILILPQFFGLNGVWMSFPIADVISAGISFFYLKSKTKRVKSEK